MSTQPPAITLPQPDHAEPATLQRLYVLISCLALAFFAAATSLLVWTIYDSRIRELTTRIGDTNGLFVEHIESVFTSINWMAASAGRAYLSMKHDYQALRSELEVINSVETYSLQLSIVDMTGKFLLSNVSAVSGTDLRDRAHIRVHLSPGGPETYVSRPLVGRVSNMPAVNVTRTFKGPDGQPAGIVVVSYDPRKLNAFFDRHDLGRDGAVALLRTDGTLIARSRTSSSASGMDLSSGAIISSFVSKGILQGTTIARSPVDGIERMYHFKVLPALSLVVVTGQSYEAVTREVLLIAALSFGIVLMLAVLLWFGGALLKRYNQGRQVAQSLLIARERANSVISLLQSAFQATGVLVVIFDLKTRDRYEFANETAQQLLHTQENGGSRTALLIGELQTSFSEGVTRLTQRLAVANDNGGRPRTRVIFWTMTRAEWISSDAAIAIGFDRTELEEAEHALFQQNRLASLGELVTSISHELAQPLTVISFAAQMISENSGSAKGELHDLLAKATERVSSTVEGMKVFGRASTNAMKGVFYLRDCIDLAVLLARNDLHLAQIVLVVDEPPEEIQIAGDLVLFEQVILNLILNARDAMLDRSLSLPRKEIQISYGAVDDAMAFVRVSDTGPGVPPAVASRIFDPFFTTKTNGTGLGLSLSYATVTQMKGTLALVPSQVGATFEIIVPRAQSQAAQSPDRAGPSSMPLPLKS